MSRSDRAVALLLFICACTAFASACVDDDGDQPVDGFVDHDAGPDIGPDVEPEPCPQLFGAPSENTGLDDGVCEPLCACGGDTWEPTRPTEADLQSWRSWQLADPWPRTLTNPYDGEAPNPEPGLVCAVRFEANTGQYELASMRAEEVPADWSVTHTSGCGACSSLQDLAVYAGVPDLTTPVRQCGLEGARDGVEAAEACIADIGFSDACAQIWAFNAMHTLDACLQPCFALLNSPYHEADGSPNACIQCDEDNSGPIFKAVSGRTRRNSGLPTALCRPCDTVSQINHVIPAAP